MPTVYPLLYRLGQTPWENNPDEGPIAGIVESRVPGRGLDAGCGSGRHAIALAERGWTVTGVDGAAQPLRVARDRARLAGVAERTTFVKGDVTRLDRVLPGQDFDLVLDIGCFHGLSAAGRERFVDWTRRHTAPDGVVIIHAVAPRHGLGPDGIDAAGLAAAFGPGWSLATTESTTCGGGPLRGAEFHWYVVRRDRAGG